MRENIGFLLTGAALGLFLGVVASVYMGKIDLLSETVNSNRVLRNNLILLDKTHGKVVLPAGLVVNLETKYREEYHVRIDFVTYNIDGFKAVDEGSSYVGLSEQEFQRNHGE